MVDEATTRDRNRCGTNSPVFREGSPHVEHLFRHNSLGFVVSKRGVVKHVYQIVTMADS